MDTTIPFHNQKEQLYLETDMSGVDLRSFLQARDKTQFPRNEAPKNAAFWPKAFPSKNLISIETWYSNTGREALGIQYGLEKFHH